MIAMTLLVALWAAVAVAMENNAPSTPGSTSDQSPRGAPPRQGGLFAGYSQIYQNEDELAGKIQWLYRERLPDPALLTGKVFSNKPFTPPLSQHGSPQRTDRPFISAQAIQAMAEARRPSAGGLPPADMAASSSAQTPPRTLARGKSVFAEDNMHFRNPSRGPLRLDKNSRETKDVWDQVHGPDSPESPQLTKNLNKEMSFSQLAHTASSDVLDDPAEQAKHDKLRELELAKAKLAAYADSKKNAKPWSKPFRHLWRWTKASPMPATPAGSSSSRESVQGSVSESTEMHTPRAHFSDEPDSPLGEEEKLQTILPYRAWSERKALRGVRIPESSGINKLTDHRVGHWEHWKSALDTFRKQTYWDKYLERMFWIARNAKQESTEHRALVNGAPTGTTSYTKLRYGPYNPEDPVPPHPGRRESVLEERMEVLQRLFYRVPPALTYHSPEVFRQNAEGFYTYAADPHIQKVVHPLHYLQQILVNPRATGILENFNAEDQQAFEEHWVYNRRLDHTISTQERSVRRVSEDKAIRNMFWPTAWQRDPAFQIKDPLTTPLEDWQVFEPYIDAVKLRP